MNNVETEQRLESVDLVIAMLELLARGSGSLSLGEVARSLSITKPRAHRHLRALCANRYVFQDEDDRYAVGSGLIALADTARSKMSLATVARPIMATLRDATGQAVTASSVIGGEVTILELLHGRTTVQFAVRPGTVLSPTRSAHGRIALAMGKIAATDGEVPHAMLAEIRAQGWAVAPGTIMTGVNTLAAPLLGRDGAYVGAIALVGSIDDIAAEPAPDMLEGLLKAAREISERLGWSIPR